MGNKPNDVFDEKENSNHLEDSMETILYGKKTKINHTYINNLIG